MSEQSAREARQAESVEPDNVVNLPSIDEMFGIDEKASTLALAAADCALRARRLDHQRAVNGETEDRPISGFRPEVDGDYEAKEGEWIGGYQAGAGQKFRTYKQQRRIAEKGLGDILSQARREEILGKVKDLAAKYIKQALEREEKLREAPPAQPTGA
jgi:hypothetical protein